MFDADSAFLNTGAPTRQDPSTGGISTPDDTIVYESFQELCDSLPSDHRPITITLNQPVERLSRLKRLVWNWMEGNLPDFTNGVESQIPKEC